MNKNKKRKKEEEKEMDFIFSMKFVPETIWVVNMKVRVTR